MITIKKIISHHDHNENNYNNYNNYHLCWFVMWQRKGANFNSSKTHSYQTESGKITKAPLSISGGQIISICFYYIVDSC